MCRLLVCGAYDLLELRLLARLERASERTCASEVDTIGEDERTDVGKVLPSTRHELHVNEVLRGQHGNTIGTRGSSQAFVENGCVLFRGKNRIHWHAFGREWHTRSERNDASRRFEGLSLPGNRCLWSRAGGRGPRPPCRR